MPGTQQPYVPAAGRDWALPFYDPVVKLLGGEAARHLLIEQAALRSGHRVLEIGCGTGSLLLAIKAQYPDIDVTGLDPDPNALDRAQRKASAASAAIALDRGYSDALPYPDGSFDRVFSCFMFHHLQGRDLKQRTLREARRVLKTDGSLHMLDFASHSHKQGALMRWLHPDRLELDGEDRVVRLMREAGLQNSTVLRHRTLLGIFHTTYYRANP